MTYPEVWQDRSDALKKGSGISLRFKDTRGGGTVKKLFVLRLSCVVFFIQPDVSVHTSQTSVIFSFKNKTPQFLPKKLGSTSFCRNFLFPEIQTDLHFPSHPSISSHGFPAYPHHTGGHRLCGRAACHADTVWHKPLFLPVAAVCQSHPLPDGSDPNR